MAHSPWNLVTPHGVCAVVSAVAHELMGNRRPSQTASGRSDAGIGAGSVVEPDRYASTPAAQARPSAMAHTISDCPRPASPATKTPGTFVAYASSRTTSP